MGSSKGCVQSTLHHTSLSTSRGDREEFVLNKQSKSEHSSPFPVSISFFDISVQNGESAFKHINGCGNCEGRCFGLGMVLHTKPCTTHSHSSVFLSLSMLHQDGDENWRHKR